LRADRRVPIDIFFPPRVGLRSNRGGQRSQDTVLPDQGVSEGSWKTQQRARDLKSSGSALNRPNDTAALPKGDSMEANPAGAAQSSFDALGWLCLFITIGLFIGAVYFLYWLGKLPGETAKIRGHPQASAITVCGWLGLLFPLLWPIALVWAYLIPAG